jgi:hypothetical protein
LLFLFPEPRIFFPGTELDFINLASVSDITDGSEVFTGVLSGASGPLTEFFRASFESGWYDDDDEIIDDVSKVEVDDTSDDFRVDSADADAALARRIDERRDRVGLERLKRQKVL